MLITNLWIFILVRTFGRDISLRGGNGSWDGLYLEEGLQKWMEDPNMVDHKALPCIFSWDIWIAKDETLFEGKSFSPLEIFHKIKFIYDDL